MRQSSPRDHDRRDGLFIRVVNGQPTAKRVHLSGRDPSIDLKALPLKSGPAAIDSFRQMLVEAGLTVPEAEGLIASWKHHFFETNGTRFLLLMSADDYDTLCPIQVRPAPTELVRVGIVLTEF